VKKSGDEAIIQVKGNQKKLLENCEKATRETEASDKYTSKEKSRNRIEKRKIEIYDNSLKHFTTTVKKQWGKYIKMIIKVERTRKKFDAKTKEWNKSFERSYYISTIELTAKESAKAVREHWRIENRNHCVKDSTMNEDKSRIRIKPELFARLRSFALNAMRTNQVENINQELYKNALNTKRLLGYNKLI
jgi:predicted transposase YbfD/YdcC